MFVHGDTIEIAELTEFLDFVKRNYLQSRVVLDKPLLDFHGNVLVNHEVRITPQILAKLERIEDNFEHVFLIKITPPVLAAMRNRMGTAICSVADGALTRHLLGIAGRNYLGMVRNAFESTSFTVFAYRLMIERPIFFSYIANLGLTCLAIALNTGVNARMVRRHAFLAGFCACLADRNESNWPLAAGTRLMNAAYFEKSAAFVDTLALPSGLADVIRAQTGFNQTPNAVANHSLFADFFDEETEDISETAEEAQSITEDREPEPVAEEAAPVLVEILRIGRFVFEGTEGPDHQAVHQLVAEMAYNTARGFFHRRVAFPILKIFQSYAREAEKMLRIAMLEKQCVHKVSAWAYPKPHATQMLCSLNMDECPLRQSGFDIHVVAEQKPFGRIGRNLPPGVYPKCRLDRKLKRLIENDKDQGENQAG